MKNSKRKTSKKGMTLIEIIISFTIVVVMSSIIVMACASITKMVKASNDMNKRVARQAPVAEANYNLAANQATEPVKIIVKSGANEIILEGNIHAADDQAEMDAHNKEAGGKLNMKYIGEIGVQTTVGP